MYVAITRARKRLYLSFAQTRMLHGQTRYHIRSRFFDELPEETLKWITPKTPGFGSGFKPQGSYSQQPRDAWSNWRGGSGGSGGHGSDLPVTRIIEKAQESATGLKIGMTVFHNKFGEGKVLRLEGSGDDARAEINFPRHGTKWLALSVAKLTIVE